MTPATAMPTPMAAHWPLLGPLLDVEPGDEGSVCGEVLVAVAEEGCTMPLPGVADAPRLSVHLYV